MNTGKGERAFQTKGDWGCTCSVASDSLQPMDCGLPGRFIRGIFQARILEWVAISFSRGIFTTKGLNTYLLLWQVDFLTESPGTTCVNVLCEELNVGNLMV